MIVSFLFHFFTHALYVSKGFGENVATFLVKKCVSFKMKNRALVVLFVAAWESTPAYQMAVSPTKGDFSWWRSYCLY